MSILTLLCLCVPSVPIAAPLAKPMYIVVFHQMRQSDLQLVWVMDPSYKLHDFCVTVFFFVLTHVGNLWWTGHSQSNRKTDQAATTTWIRRKLAIYLTVNKVVDILMTCEAHDFPITSRLLVCSALQPKVISHNIFRPTLGYKLWHPLC